MYGGLDVRPFRGAGDEPEARGKVAATTTQAPSLVHEVMPQNVAPPVGGAN